MDVTIDLLDNAAFREARKGYNTQDVDEFIEQVKEGVQRSEAQIAELRARAEQAERRAAEAAEHGSGEAEETAVGRALVLAQSTADATVKAAEEEAGRKIAAAEEQVGRLEAEARDASARARADAEREAVQAQEEARTRVLNELHQLEAERDSLRGEVEALVARAGEQRERVRFAASELQRLLDDPTALRPISPPEPTPAPEEPTGGQPTAGEEEAPTGGEPPSEARSEPEASDAGETDPPSPDAPESSDRAPGDDAAEQRPLAPTAGPADEAPSAEPSEEAGDGPPTQPVDVLADRKLGEDDAYLAELRKAMTDDSPLGPREGNDTESLFESGDDAPRSRFGRRR